MGVFPVRARVLLFDRPLARRLVNEEGSKGIYISGLA